MNECERVASPCETSLANLRESLRTHAVVITAMPADATSEIITSLTDDIFDNFTDWRIE
jgi:N-acetyl-gamma-glutamylphosphate reductase